MGYNDTRSGGSAADSAWSYTHSRSMGLAVLAALVFLVVIRYFYGSIRIEGGVK